MDASRIRSVYAVIERGHGRSFRMKLGVGFVNRDGSLTLKLDAVPLSRTLHVRALDRREHDRDAICEEFREELRETEGVLPFGPANTNAKEKASANEKDKANATDVPRTFTITPLTSPLAALS